MKLLFDTGASKNFTRAFKELKGGLPVETPFATQKCFVPIINKKS